jgi:hypothetical protein
MVQAFGEDAGGYETAKIADVIIPSMGFATTILPEEIFAALKGTPTFAAIDKEKPGSPVSVRVSHMYGHPSTAANIASAILVGGTLGLLPGFSNHDLIVTYEILVNGSVLLSYTYAKNLTRVYNVHATDKTHGLGSEGVAWVTGTAAQFAADVARDARFAELQAEYHYYYGTPAAAAAR